MMVTAAEENGVVGEGEQLLPLICNLEGKDLQPENKLASYKTLTEKLHKENFQVFLDDFSRNGSRLVNIFSIDMMNPMPDISQAALQAVGFCIYHDEIVATLSELDIDMLLKALQNVLLKASDKGTCTRALWCLAKQTFPVQHTRTHLHELLCSLEHVLLKGDFKSVTIQHEAINAIIKLLESLPDEMLVNTLRWSKLILPSLVHSAVKVRVRALVAFQLGLPAMLKYKQELASSIIVELKGSIVSEMSKLFACKHELYVLEIWGYFVQLLGKAMHRGGSLINLMLNTVEQGFKHQSADVKIAAFHAWKILIENFSLDQDILYNQKRIKLLVQPFKVNNAKVESVAMVKFDVWWFLIKMLGPKAATNFDQVCAPLLQFSLGFALSNGVHCTPSSGTGNGMKHLLNTPVLRKGASTPVTPMLHLGMGSPGTIHPIFKSIQLKGIEALAHFLGKWDSSIGLPRPSFMLDPLKCDIITSPTLFNKIGHTLLQAITVACCSLVTDVASTQLFHIWYSIVAHLKNLIDSTSKKDSSDILSHFLICIQSIVKADTLHNSTILRLFEAASALPNKALSSSSYSTGSGQPLHGTPSLFLIGLLFNDSLVESLEERFFCVFEAFVNCGMTTPGGALGFSQSVFSLVDTATVKISNKEHVWRLWSIIVHPLLREIVKSNEVNQGDSLEHDFSTMYAALTLPVKHIFPNSISQASLKSLLKTWAELDQAFARCSALVPTAEANHGCEILVEKILKILDDKALLNLTMLDSVSQMCLILIDNFDFSSFSNEVAPTPLKRSGQCRWPLGNLTSFVKLVCRVTNAVHDMNDEVKTPFFRSVRQLGPASPLYVTVMSNLLGVLTKLFSHLTMSKHLTALLEKLMKSIAAFYNVQQSRTKVTNKLQASTVEDKLQKFWVDLLTSVQSRVKGPYDTKFLAIMSPGLEQTLNHSKRSIRNQSILFWNASFGKAEYLEYPETIKLVLMNVKKKTPLLLPNWKDTQEGVEETQTSEFPDVDGTQSFVEAIPIVHPFGTPSPHKMHGSFLRRPTESEKLITISSPRRHATMSPARLSLPSPKILSGVKGTRRRLNIDEDSKVEFVKISASPKKKKVPTATLR